MKKATLLIGTGLLASTFVLMSQTVNAEDVKTTGEVSFTKGGGPVDPDKAIKLVKPGTKEKVIYLNQKTEGTSTGDDLRFSFVPNIKFGSVKVSSVSERHPALPLEYTEKDPETAAEAENPKFKIPPFVQVIDETGNKDGFEVKAGAEVFKVKETTGLVETTDLQNTRIEFTGQTLRNTLLDGGAGDADAASMLAGFAAEGSQFLVPSNDVVIMNSKTDVDTNASASSSVFQADYKHTIDYSTPDNIKMKNVLLNVPAGERPKAGKTYVTNITWVLEKGV
ncbi:WxL domain-containing protein [Vagococcus silagei]|uniref:WxL domain-containing protein n=1 Tax=Vagococcus silagei TaxID=2508885 RepID=A0A4S3B8U9_9ENTE|nr:WxL domain-containing protein [Vagococcus silagei]THB62336.1 WxL domain-containing protein [Vagococcus silagei]